jgi:glutamate synthase domain-containing protein 3
MQGLRSRVRLETDGQMRTGLDVAIAAALGADEFGFSTAPLIVEGCVMMRKCHLNTCPVGVATQDPELRKKFTGQPEHVTNYFFFVANELREILQGLGFTSVSELIGRTDLLEQIASEHWKVRTLDLSRLLVRTTCQIPHEKTIYRYLATPLRPGDDFEDELNAKCASAIEQAKPLTLQLQINNNQRTLGTSLSAVIAQRYGAQGLPSNTLTLECTGCAGQSFGAFLAKGLTLRLTGEANDFVGKGLSGGRIVIQPATQRARESNQVLAGNACVYGATTGEVFIAGAAGERFAVRNSGAIVIVEGIGDHGCEYMTGGTAIILGRFGRNFGAGMSGGQVFVFDEFDDLNSKLGSNELEVRALQLQSGAGNEDLALKKLLERYALETDSVKARRLLSDWEKWRVYFKILIPLEYKRALAAAQVSARESAGKELIYE